MIDLVVGSFVIALIPVALDLAWRLISRGRGVARPRGPRTSTAPHRTCPRLKSEGFLRWGGSPRRAARRHKVKGGQP